MIDSVLDKRHKPLFFERGEEGGGGCGCGGVDNFLKRFLDRKTEQGISTIQLLCLT